MDIIELVWGPPFEIDGVKCHAAVLDGEWLVASSARPRFCFHGVTREEAEATALRGLTFYRAAIERRNQ